MLRHLTIRRRLTTAGAFWLLTAAAAGVAPLPSAAAQQDDPSAVAAARALAVEGVKLAQDSRCGDAIDKLERAERLRHSAIVLEQLGECYIGQGRFVEGAEAMRVVLREGLPEGASDTLKRAHGNARTQLEATRAKIAQLTITVEGEAGAQTSVAIDGQPMPVALIGAARPTDPGEHTVEVSAPGFLAVKRRVSLSAGQLDSLALTLVADPALARAKPAPVVAAPEAEGASAPAALPAASTPNAVAAAAHSGPNRLPAFASWGVSAGALAVGVVFGWVASDQKSDLDRACPDQRCPSTQRGKLDAARTNGTISTVAFAVAGGTAVLGGVLFFLASAGEAPPAAAKAEANSSIRPAAAARATASLGLARVDLQLQF